MRLTFCVCVVAEVCADRCVCMYGCGWLLDLECSQSFPFLGLRSDQRGCLVFGGWCVDLCN